MATPHLSGLSGGFRSLPTPTPTAWTGRPALPGGEHALRVAPLQPPLPSSPGVVHRPSNPSPSQAAVRALNGVQDAQRRLEKVMSLAAAGRSFSPAELLSFQARIYQSSQEIDLASKVLEKASGGLKQVLQTAL